MTEVVNRSVHAYFEASAYAAVLFLGTENIVYNKVHETKRERHWCGSK